jgi:hypothetical protein
VKRAISLAEGHTALRAPTCLIFRGIEFEIIVDLIKIINTLRGVALWRCLFLRRNEFQHF